jgi:hypothetical protein
MAPARSRGLYFERVAMAIVLFEDCDGDLYLLDEVWITVHPIDGVLVEGGAYFVGDAANIESGVNRGYWDQFTVAFDEFDFVSAEPIAVYDAGDVTVLAEPGANGRDYLELPVEETEYDWG